MNDYLTAYGTDQARLKLLHELLRYRTVKSETRLATTGKLDSRLQTLRDLFVKRAQAIASSLPPDHPIMMPFGLLGDLSIAQLHETMHTRMLAWLLDPDMPHRFGTVLLRALLNEAGAGLLELTNVQVHTEFPLPSDLGRVDIFATGKTVDSEESWGLWIEAKSKQVTQEGQDQLSRYEQHRSAWRRNTAGRDYGIFLTPDGRYTRSTENPQQWVTLSYSRLADLLWREAGSHRDALGFEWLRLYLSSIIKGYLSNDWESESASELLNKLSYFQILDLEASL